MKKSFIVLSLLAVLSFVTLGASASAQVNPSSKFPTRTTTAQSAPKSSGITFRLHTMATTGTVTGIDFTWANSQSVPACPTNGTPTNCYNGFTLTDTTTNQVLATAAVLGPTASSYLYTPSGGMYFGTQTFSIVVTGYDGSGNPIQSAAVTTSVSNNVTSLNPVTNFTGVTK